MFSFNELLEQESKKSYFIDLMERLTLDRKSKQIFPGEEEVFRALRLTELSEVKVVIIGQDPYHGKDQANGLAFSVIKSVKIPPSLRNIYKEVEQSTGYKMANHGDLTQWAQQGVLLLNSILTVEEGKPLSHKDYGWQRLTDEVIKLINKERHHVVYLLFGAHAKKYKEMIDDKQNYVFCAAHPSPLSAFRGFFGSQVFELANHVLENLGIGTIDWQIK